MKENDPIMLTRSQKRQAAQAKKAEIGKFVI
jgi:hypothetical protein